MESIACHAGNKVGLVNDMTNLAHHIPFERITVPYLNIHGKNDGVVTYEQPTEQAKGVANVEIVLIEGGSHVL